MIKRKIFLSFMMIFITFLLLSCDLLGNGDNVNDGNQDSDRGLTLEVDDASNLLFDSYYKDIRFTVGYKQKTIMVSSFHFNPEPLGLYFVGDDNKSKVKEMPLNYGPNKLTLGVDFENENINYSLLIEREYNTMSPPDISGMSIDGVDCFVFDKDLASCEFSVANEITTFSMSQIKLPIKYDKMSLHTEFSENTSIIELREGNNEIYCTYFVDDYECKLVIHAYRRRVGEEPNKILVDFRITYFKVIYKLGEEYTSIDVALMFRHGEERSTLDISHVEGFDTSKIGYVKLKITYGHITKEEEIQVVDLFKNPRTITVLDYEGNVAKTFRVEDGTELTEDMMPIPKERPGMEFRKWSAYLPMEITMDITIEPIYISLDRIFTITVDLGTSKYEIKIDKDSRYVIDIPEAPDSDHVFDHFEYEGQVFNRTGFYKYNKNITITAVFVKNYNEIAYLDCDNLSSPNLNPTKIKDGEYFVLQPVEKEAYTFLYWENLLHEEVSDVSFVGNDEVITLRAVFKKNN